MRLTEALTVSAASIRSHRSALTPEMRVVWVTVWSETAPGGTGCPVNPVAIPVTSDGLSRLYSSSMRSVIFVGDASMSPYEIMQPGGSIEHWNDEAGAVWMQRLTQRFHRHAWLNPEPEDRWDYTASIGITRACVAALARISALTMVSTLAISASRRAISFASALLFVCSSSTLMPIASSC